jgi:hypothetical protein
VALNFDCVPKRVTLPLVAEGVWREVVSNRLYDWHQDEIELTLEPWQGVLFLYEGSA